jgi:lipopolysaccharide transport system ATP-binding protein
MSRREIDRKFDEIVAFAEVEKFLDTPVKRYSSGMYVRLAFAVAAHLEPEILIVDEVLAVGDQSFQKKCTQRMGEVSREGRTVLVVSHDLPMVQKLSTRVVWMREGRVQQTGEPEQVIDAYHVFATAETENASVIDLDNHPNRARESVPLLRRLKLTDAAGRTTNSCTAGGEIWVEIDFRPVSFEPNVAVDICDVMGSPIGQISTYTHPSSGPVSMCGTLRCRIAPPLLPGEYAINVRLGDSEDWRDVVTSVARLTILPSNCLGTGRLPQRKYGEVLISAEWYADERLSDLPRDE